VAGPLTSQYGGPIGSDVNVVVNRGDVASVNFVIIQPS